ncbi:MAG: hypothetical protein E6R03_08040 [Hyphomicrobiaceae bacterium]|nr:MAG: hypothetical protein E6R03_08040 [Hyphomicrobiaceae bacterium]
MKKSFLKSKTVHGLKTGNHSNPNVLRAAGASGGSCMVEGASARPSMSKPKMMRADGGGVQISEDSKGEAKRLRDSANERMSAKKTMDDAASGAKTMIAGGIIHGLSRGKVGRAIGSTGMVAGPAAAAATMGSDMIKAGAERKEAGRIERGMVEPGKEDRKNGGGIMPRFKAKKTDKDDC